MRASMYRKMQEGTGEPAEHHTRCLPPMEFEFSTLVFAEFLHRLQKFGYTEKSGAVHVAIFRRYVQRLVNQFDCELEVNWDAFGGDKLPVWLTWKDIRAGVVAKAVPPASTNGFERVLLTLEDASSSMLASIYSFFMFLCILASVGLVIIQSYKDLCSAKKGCYEEVEIFCVIAFSADYFGRFICVPFSRTGIFDRDWLLATSVPDPVSRSATLAGGEMKNWERLVSFVFKPLNIVDFIAILPFWLTLLVGEFLPFPLAFIRSLRLIRFLRIMKMGKFNTTLQVLGTTLANSAQSMYVLLIYVFMTCIMSGVIYNQLEEEKPFRTVPNAAWWVGARMVQGMHKAASWVDGRPQTYLGAALLTALMVFKGMLWILPYAQIGDAFKQSWKENEEIMKVRQNVEIEDNRSPDRVWVEDRRTPVVDVEVWEGDNFAGKGTLPVPILESKNASAVVTTTLSGGGINSCIGTPSLDFKISWRPTEVKDGASRGSLSIQPLRGTHFGSGSKWECVVGYPLGLSPQQSEHTWKSGPSTGGPSPTWNGPAGTFEINMIEPANKDDGKPKTKPDESSHCSNAELQKVLTLLEADDRNLMDLTYRTVNIAKRTVAIEKHMVDKS